MTAEVYDVFDRPLVFLDNGLTGPGRHTITLDISRLTSGIYLYIVSIGNEHYTHRMIVE
jgi:hypothetical protein